MKTWWGPERQVKSKVFGGNFSFWVLSTAEIRSQMSQTLCCVMEILQIIGDFWDSRLKWHDKGCRRGGARRNQKSRVPFSRASTEYDTPQPINSLAKSAFSRGGSQTFRFSLYVFSHPLLFLDTSPAVNNTTSVKLNSELFPCSEGVILQFNELLGHYHDPVIFPHSSCLVWPCKRSGSITAAWKMSGLNFMPELLTQYLFFKN